MTQNWRCLFKNAFFVFSNYFKVDNLAKYHNKIYMIINFEKPKSRGIFCMWIIEINKFLGKLNLFKFDKKW